MRTIVTLLILIAQLHARTLYVDLAQGNDANAGTGPGAQALQTIGHSINVAQPGDTFSVAAGTYDSDENFDAVGTAALPIAWKASGKVIITGPITLSGQYETIDGITSGMPSIGASQWWVQFTGSRCTVSNFVFDGIPYSGSGNDEATAFWIQGNHNTALNCHVANVDNTDCYRIFGDSNVIDGCTTFNLKNTLYANGAHADNIQTWGGCSNALVQNCFFQPVNPDAPHQLGMLDTNPGGNTGTVHDNTIRNNVFVGGEHLFALMQNTRLLNNTFYKTGGSIGDILFLDQKTYSGYEIRNNAFFDCGNNAGNGFIQGGIQSGTIVDTNYFAWNGPGPVSHMIGTNGVNGGDPRFVNPPIDFHVQAGSALITQNGATIGAFPFNNPQPTPTPPPVPTPFPTPTPLPTPIPTPTPLPTPVTFNNWRTSIESSFDALLKSNPPTPDK